MIICIAMIIFTDGFVINIVQMINVIDIIVTILDNMIVSRMIDVMIPLNIANIIILMVDHPDSVNTNWNAAIVPKSPMEQPIKHHIVLYADFPQTSRSDQLKSIDIGTASTVSQQDLTPPTSDMMCPNDSGFSIVVYCCTIKSPKIPNKMGNIPLDFQE